MHAQSVRMRQIKHRLGRSVTKGQLGFNPQICKNPMVGLAGLFFGKQAKKDKHIAQAHTLTLQMGLRSARLTKGAAPVGQKHRIVMAQIVAPQFTTARPSCVLAQSQIAICRARETFGVRDRQGDRGVVYDRRRPAARAGIKTLA